MFQLIDGQNTIGIRTDPKFSYSDIINKIVHKSRPIVTKLVRRIYISPKVYRLSKKLSESNLVPTDFYIKVLSCKKRSFITISNAEAKDILGTDSPPLNASYLWDLKKYLEKYEFEHIWHKGKYYIKHEINVYVCDIEYVPSPDFKTFEEFLLGEFKGNPVPAGVIPIPRSKPNLKVHKPRIKHKPMIVSNSYWNEFGDVDKIEINAPKKKRKKQVTL